ncbi:hypothetical protein B0T14DRAFT_146118 [Immersiella caudata]|uniref:BTB domain-containing protein n=1 Tax=Immersiella caudata TaxID=314043 RepID=A0AA39X5Y8_9PEZI|nr:hypothetical protein B0T14DRAFT_146118 [Immersiella caudata]
MAKKKKNNNSQTSSRPTSRPAIMASNLFGEFMSVGVPTIDEPPAASPNPETKTIDYEDIVSSPMFGFSIGPQKREFPIHSALISNQSPAFERLVNGAFKEAREFRAELDDVDEGTFTSFAQYAYTGNYGSEKPITVPSEVDSFEWCSNCEERRIWELLNGESRRCGSQQSPANSGEPRNAMAEKRFRQMVSSLQIPQGPSFIKLRQQDAHAQNALLAHAKVFVFADYWGVDRLRGLSLRELGRMLEEGELTEEKIEEITELMEYGYDEPRPDDLTKLLLLYSACHVNQLWKSERFRAVFSRHSELSMSLIGAMIGTM